MKKSITRGFWPALMVVLSPIAANAQLSADWMVPAAAHNPGLNGTFWRTDLSLHNPHDYELPVIVQALPSDTVNDEVLTMTLNLQGWETLNLWDVLGPDGFDLGETAAILAYADPALVCDPIEECHFLVTSRTYTPGGDGEFGLTVAGAQVERGGGWATLSYAAGVLNDGVFFRCNVGVASWSTEWVDVRLDVQDSAGNIVASDFFEVPPFGHTQHRLETEISGGSLVFYLDSGPDEALIFPYATVIDEVTGDASYSFAEASSIGTDAKDRIETSSRPQTPAIAGEVTPQPREMLGVKIQR